MPEFSINIQNVNKRFGLTHAVRDLDLRVPVGSLCGFLGPNGAGKSTTIRMIMSIILPDTGSVEVMGSDALRNKDRIGYLPEERGLYRKMRVGEFLHYVGRLKGAGGADLSRRINHWLERINLSEVVRHRCQELSKGMQQKIQFLASIIHDPELIILDEPFSGLDPVNTSLLNQLIRELNEQGKTIIFSTHVLHQAELICDRIFLINHGVKLLDSSLEEIRRTFDPKTIIVEPLDEYVDLSTAQGVHAVHSSNGQQIHELEIESDADPQAVMQAVMNMTQVRRIELRRPTLEDVFVELVMKDEGEAAAEEVRRELSHV